MAKLFFSYSHQDEDLRDQLEVQLEMLKKQGVVETWHDRCIRVGDHFGNEIDSQLEAADVVLLLVSPDFLASDYCYNVEFSKAMERHAQGLAKVISVILRPCDWKASSLSDFLVAPKDGRPVTMWPNRDEAFLNVVQLIRAALRAESSGPSRPVAQVAPALRSAVVRPGPRSSNLRLKREFSDADKDRFLDATFEYIARFFENSLAELEGRNEGIETRFKKVDANTFCAYIYQAGKKVSACRVHNRGMGGMISGISYSHDDSDQGNSYNEALTVDADDQSMFMTATLMSGFLRDTPEKLSEEGAAEHYWGLLIETLRWTHP